MAFDLDNEELKATRKMHGQDDGLYEDKNDKNIVSEDDIKALKKDLFYYDEIHENLDDDTVNFYEALRHILLEREQDKKRIKELEEELEKANRQLDLDYVDDNYIPRQKVKDKIEEHKYYLLNQAITSNPTLDSHFRDKEKYVIQVLQKLLEGENKDEL